MPAIRSGPFRTSLPVLLVLPLLLTSCVRRVHEAPGLTPDSPLAVGNEMRVERFEEGDYEVRVFRLPVSERDDQAYEFIVLEEGYETTRFVLEQLEGGQWALIERRPDGISASHRTWSEGPAYQAVRSEVVRLLRERDGRDLG